MIARGKKSSTDDDDSGKASEKKSKKGKETDSVDRSSKSASKVAKPYPESRLVEVNGEKYRLCAAALVFNDRGEVLVGERSDRPGSWNMPQGGVEAGETTREAATRELFEETGVRTFEEDASRGVVRVIGELPKDDGYCYKVEGESWLSKRGLAGQRLEFCVFHWSGARDDPMEHECVDLGGLSGEPKEFARLKWMDFDDLVRDVWGTKKAPYSLARESSRTLIGEVLKKK